MSLILKFTQTEDGRTDREAREGDLDVGVDQVPGLPPEGVLQVGHDGGVHPRKAVSSVDSGDDEKHYLPSCLLLPACLTSR